MRITVITIGSRGDAQPYTALAVGLARRGHDVTLATHETFRSLVEGAGVRFKPIAGDPAAIVAAADRWVATGRARDAVPGARYFLRVHGPLLDSMLADYWQVAQGSDALIYSNVAFPAWSVAERLGIPGIAAGLQPLHRTSAFPFIGVPRGWSLGGRFNAATYSLAGRLIWESQRRRITRWRAEALGLPPRRWQGPFGHFEGSDTGDSPAIYGYSSLVVDRPADWGPSVHVTGYWTLPLAPGWQPPAALERFLDAGPPPVYIGFGSLTPQKAERLTRIAVEALHRSQQRGVLLSGWGQLGSGLLPGTVFAVRDVPHEWLFSRMGGIVHHGGAGTTGAALRAGVPSVIVPLGFDQPYWGRRVAALGVAAEPIARHRLTAARLARAIDQLVHDGPLRTRAAALGARVRAERGVEAAVEVIERAVRS